MKKTVALLIIVLATFTSIAHAGSNARGKAQFAPERIVNFAKEVEKYAASQGARAFILARRGRPQDDLPKGVRFTHTAVAVYSTITLADGEQVMGYAIHNLYQNADDPSRSSLVVDYPVDFFWSAQALEAGIIIPAPELQTRLINAIATGVNQKLHNPRYSVVANPFTSKYQNCTEHTLDVINAAIYQHDDIARLKATAKAHFSAQKISTSPFKLMLGDWLVDGVSTDDHKGRVQTATYGSIQRYLDAYGLAQQSLVLFENGQSETL